MMLSDYRSHIVNPISEVSHVGARLFDDPVYDFIDEQMMKVGSLSHSSVQWKEVERSAFSLLKEKSKDIKLLIALIQCLHNQTNLERFTLSFWLLGDFMTHFWNDCFPAPGARGKLPRRKFFSLLLQRYSLAVERFDFESCDEHSSALLLEAVEHWHQAIIKAGLDSDSVQQLINRINAELSRAEEKYRINQSNPHKIATSTNATHKHHSQFSSTVIDRSSSQSIKQSLLNLASFLSEQEFGFSLAIRIQRYAVWSSIDSLPEHNAKGETQLRGMPPDRIKEYSEGLSHPDLLLWRKIEQSLTLSPYWFEGQLMSYQVAQSLEEEEWCDAIINETRRFLSRLPKLSELTFKDGSPFVSDEVKQWLENHDSNVTGGISGDWQDKRANIIRLAKEGGLSVAMTALDEELEKAIVPRDKFYWRFLLAELLEENNLKSMANEHYKMLHQQVSPMTVSDWEPSFIEQIEKLVTTI